MPKKSLHLLRPSIRPRTSHNVQPERRGRMVGLPEKHESDGPENDRDVILTRLGERRPHLTSASVALSSAPSVLI